MRSSLRRSRRLSSLVLAMSLLSSNSWGEAGDRQEHENGPSDQTVRTESFDLATRNGLAFGGLSLLFYDDSLDAETIQWSGASDRFEIGNDLMVRYAIQVGSDDPGDPLYSYFGDDNATSGQLGTLSDLFVDDDLELGGTLFLSRAVYMEGSASPTDGDQSIFFADDGSRSNEYLRWDDSEDHFLLTNGLRIDGTLLVGTEEASGPSTYSRFADNQYWGPIETGDFYGPHSVYVEKSLEIGDTLFVVQRSPSDLVATLYGSSEYAYLDGELDGTVLNLRTRGPQVVFVADRDNDTTNASPFDWRNNGTSASNRLMELNSEGTLRIAGSLQQSYSFDVAELFVAGEPLEPGELVRLSSSSPPTVTRTAGDGDATVIGVVSGRPGVQLGAAPFALSQLRDVWGDEIASRFRDEREELSASVLDADPDLAAQLDALVLEVENEGADESDKVSAQAAVEARTEYGRERPERAATRLDELRSTVEGRSLERFFERHFAAVALAGRVPVTVDASHAAIAPGDLLAPGPTPGVAVKATLAGPIVGTALEELVSGRGAVLALIHRGWYTPTRGPSDPSPPPSQTTQATLEAGGHATPRTVAPRREDGADRADEGSLAAPAGSSEPLHAGSCSDPGETPFRVRPQGNLHATYVPLSEAVEVGDVVVADLEYPGTVRLGFRATDTAVVGIVTREPGILLGGELEAMARVAPELADELTRARRRGDRRAAAVLRSAIEARFEAIHAGIALAGIVETKVDAGYGAIQVGDLLTTSPTLGHAMRTLDPQPGTIVGKALEPLEAGVGRIEVLVMLR